MREIHVRVGSEDAELLQAAAQLLRRIGQQMTGMERVVLASRVAESKIEPEALLLGVAAICALRPEDSEVSRACDGESYSLQVSGPSIQIISGETANAWRSRS